MENILGFVVIKSLSQVLNSAVELKQPQDNMQVSMAKKTLLTKLTSGQIWFTGQSADPF